MAISVAARKAKGRKLQQWVCEMLSKLFQIPWGSEDDKLISSRPMSHAGTDIILRGEAANRIPFSIECKHHERWRIDEFVEQARKNESDGKDWLLILKKNNIKPVAVLDADVLLQIIAAVDTLMDANLPSTEGKSDNS